MHRRTDMQSLRLTKSDVKGWSGVSKSFCAEIISLKDKAIFWTPVQRDGKGASCMGVTAPQKHAYRKQSDM